MRFARSGGRRRGRKVVGMYKEMARLARGVAIAKEIYKKSFWST